MICFARDRIHVTLSCRFLSLYFYFFFLRNYFSTLQAFMVNKVSIIHSCTCLVEYPKVFLIIEFFAVESKILY